MNKTAQADGSVILVLLLFLAATTLYISIVFHQTQYCRLQAEEYFEVSKAQRFSEAVALWGIALCKQQYQIVQQLCLNAPCTIPADALQAALRREQVPIRNAVLVLSSYDQAIAIKAHVTVNKTSASTFCLCNQIVLNNEPRYQITNWRINHEP